MISSTYAHITDMNIIPNNRAEWTEFLSKDGDIFLQRVTHSRTPKQNNAIHKYCELVSTALCEKGLKFKFYLGTKIVQLDWTPTRVKEDMWKPIQEALLGKKSTKELNNNEDINIVYDHLNRFLSTDPEIMIHVPFPHEEKVENKPVENYPTETYNPVF